MNGPDRTGGAAGVADAAGRAATTGVGESPTVGAPAAIANAVVDALWHLGVRHVDIPITPPKLWKLLRENGVTE